MATLAIKFDGRERLSKRLAKIREACGDLTPALNDAGEIMRSSIEENFLSEGRFESASSYRGGSNRWQDLRDTTKTARKKIGKWPGKILQVSGQLASSISYEVKGNELHIGTNKVYAAIHQFGGLAGRNKSVKIPARTYLVIQDEDIEDILDEVEKYISGD